MPNFTSPATDDNITAVVGHKWLGLIFPFEGDFVISSVNQQD